MLVLVIVWNALSVLFISGKRRFVPQFHFSWQGPIFSAVKTNINLRMFVAFLRK